MALFAASSCAFRLSALATATLVGVATLVGPERVALADNVSPDGKGIVGGGLLGAELVTIVEGIADVRSGWAYGIGAVVGAGGGAVGGYFVEQNSSDGKVPVYMLAGGLALIIPAIVLTLNGTRYRPQEGATDDNVPAAAPAADPGTPGGGVIGHPSSSAPAPASQPTSSLSRGARGARAAPAARGDRDERPALSLVDVHGGTLRIGVPAVDVRPVFSMADQRQYGMHAQTEVRMPMLRVVF
jgi:hypothetical protein